MLQDKCKEVLRYRWWKCVIQLFPPSHPLTCTDSNVCMSIAAVHIIKQLHLTLINCSLNIVYPVHEQHCSADFHITSAAKNKTHFNNTQREIQTTFSACIASFEVHSLMLAGKRRKCINRQVTEAIFCICFIHEVNLQQAATQTHKQNALSLVGLFVADGGRLTFHSGTTLILLGAS